MKHLDSLVPEFRAKVDALLAALAAKGHNLRPYYGVRHPLEQAKLWRQSRTTFQVEAQIERLRQQGAPHLAGCLVKVGPCNGPRVTGALPGLSWHQWGEAVDCFLVNSNGSANWNAGASGYIAYAEEARQHGLKAGRDFGDTPHVQLRQQEVPQLFRIDQVDAAMCQRFPDVAALA